MNRQTDIWKSTKETWKSTLNMEIWKSTLKHGLPYLDMEIDSRSRGLFSGEDNSRGGSDQRPYTTWFGCTSTIGRARHPYGPSNATSNSND